MDKNEYEHCGMTAFEGCQIICELAGAMLVLWGIDLTGANAILVQIVSDKRDLAIDFVLKWFVGEQTKKGVDVQGKEFCQIVGCALQEGCEQRKGKRFISRKPPSINSGSGGIFGPVLSPRLIVNGSNLPT